MAARLSINSRVLDLGSFDNYEDPAAARELAEVQHYNRNKE